MPASTPSTSRAKRALARVACALGLGVTFALALVLGVAVHLNLPASRRVIASRIGSLLADSFRGRVMVEHVGRLGLGGASGVRVRVLDPDGRQVLLADGRVGLRVSFPDAGRSALFGKGDIAVDVRELTVDYADVSLDSDASGALRIQQAFEPRTPPAPAAPGSRELALQIEHAAIGHAWVHGQMKDAPPLDADLDAQGGRVSVTPARTTIDVDRSRVATRAAPRGADLHGEAETHLSMPSATGAELALVASFVGDVGAIPLAAQASLDGERLDAVADVRHATADELRALTPEAPIYGDVALHAEAHGSLDSALAVSADAEVGPGGAALRGNVTLGTETTVQASLWARGIDVRTFSPSAPASRLAANLETSLAVKPDGGVRGHFNLGVLPGRVADRAVPPATVHGDFTEAGVRGEAQVAEPGAPTHVAFDVRALPDGTVVDVDARTQVPRLDAIPRLGPIAQGRAELRATARLDLGAEQVDAHAHATLAEVSGGALKLGRGAVDARIHGRFDAPAVDAALHADELVAPGIGAITLSATAVGPLMSPLVTASADSADGSHVEARAAVDASRGVTVREARASLARGGETAVVTVDAVRVTNGTIVVDDATLEGIGDPVHASARVTPAEVALRANAKDLDLYRLARLARIERYVSAGRLGLDVDLVVRGDQAHGSLSFDLAGGSIEGLQADAHVDARLMDRRVFGNLAAKVPGIGYAYVNTSTLELGGAVLQPASWRSAHGSVQVDAEGDLAKVVALLPKDTLPLGELKGTVTVEGEVVRADARAVPDLQLAMRTKGLTIAAKPVAHSRVDGTKVVQPPAWRSTDLDLALDASLTGGRSHLEARVLDRHGLIVGFDGRAELPFQELADEPERALVRLESVPFDLRLWVPRRPIASLPSMFRTSGMKGTLELSMHAEGTALEPRIGLVARTDGIKGTGSPVATPTAAEVNGTYDGKTVDARLEITAREGKVLAATSHVHLRATDLLDPPPGELPWDASGLAQFNRFPLQSVARIADMRVRGHVSGEVGLADLHKDARAQAKIRFDDLKVGAATYTGGFVNATLDGKVLDAAARLDQEAGFAETHAKVGMRWGKELAPATDDHRGAQLSFKADDFRAAALLPFVDETFSELDGKIDADALVDIAPDKQRVTMTGRAKLTEGVFEIPAIGEEFRGAKATVTLSPDGVIRAEDISARGVTGQILASAAARLDGLGLAGARAAIRIPNSRPIPLSVEGQGMGEVSGDIRVDAKVAPDKKSVNVVVDIPQLRARLPDVDTRTLQPLEPEPTIRVGVRRTPRQLTLVPLGAPVEARPGDAMRWNVLLKLSSVEVRRGTTLRALIEGSPTLTIDEDTRMSGQLRLRGGTLDVQGKRFEIEKGTITFAGEPDNPIVVVTASWVAPEGTRVYADYVGPLKTGKVTLRSEPGLPRNEILSLILFGTQGGNTAPPPGQAPTGATQAAGLGGGIATQGLNRAMEDLTGLDLTARIDTSDSSNPRPELELQIAKNVSLQVAYVLGIPPPGTNPDKSLLTLDWRFFRNFSLQTTVGDRGSSILDLIWRKRY